MQVELDKIVNSWNALGDHSLEEQLIFQQLFEMVSSLIRTLTAADVSAGRKGLELDMSSPPVVLANFGANGPAHWSGAHASVPGMVMTSTHPSSGTPEARLSYLLEQLGRRFPESSHPLRSDPPEDRFLQAIDRILKPAAAIKSSTTHAEAVVGQNRVNDSQPYVPVTQGVRQLCSALMLSNIMGHFPYSRDELIALLGGIDNVSAIATQTKEKLKGYFSPGQVERGVLVTQQILEICQRLCSRTPPASINFSRDELFEALGGISVVSYYAAPRQAGT